MEWRWATYLVMLLLLPTKEGLAIGRFYKVFTLQLKTKPNEFYIVGPIQKYEHQRCICYDKAFKILYR